MTEKTKEQLINEILEKIEKRGKLETIFSLIEMVTELEMARDELVKVLIDAKHLKPVPERPIHEEWVS
jgi:hypothetical protein